MSVLMKTLTAVAMLTVMETQANNFELAEEATLLKSSVKDFQIIDMNGDSRNDIVYLDVNGDLWIDYAKNNALATLENLAGSKWRMEYNDNTNTMKIVEFFIDGGVIKEESGRLFKINSLTQSENNKLMFCTSTSSGLNKTTCNWKYHVSSIEPHIMKGSDVRTGNTWIAYKLVQ